MGGGGELKLEVLDEFGFVEPVHGKKKVTLNKNFYPDEEKK